MKGTIIFETERLILRQFTAEDASLIHQLNQDPEVLKYLHEQPVNNEKQALTILLTILLPQYRNDLGRWAIYIKTDQTFVGWCGLKYMHSREETDLGYRLLKKEWGKGYATEAARQTLDYGFKKLRLASITGRAHIENIASVRVLEKIGMQYSCEEVVDGVPVKTYNASNPWE